MTMYIVLPILFVCMGYLLGRIHGFRAADTGRHKAEGEPSGTKLSATSYVLEHVEWVELLNLDDALRLTNRLVPVVTIRANGEPERWQQRSFGGDWFRRTDALKASYPLWEFLTDAVKREEVRREIAATQVPSETEALPARRTPYRD